MGMAHDVVKGPLCYFPPLSLSMCPGTALPWHWTALSAVPLWQAHAPSKLPCRDGDDGGGGFREIPGRKPGASRTGIDEAHPVVLAARGARMVQKKTEPPNRFHDPLEPGDTREATVSCRRTHPDNCSKHYMASVCAFVRSDGMCTCPPRSWPKQYEKLSGEKSR